MCLFSAKKSLLETISISQFSLFFPQGEPGPPKKDQTSFFGFLMEQSRQLELVKYPSAATKQESVVLNKCETEDHRLSFSELSKRCFAARIAVRKKKSRGFPSAYQKKKARAIFELKPQFSKSCQSYLTSVAQKVNLVFAVNTGENTVVSTLVLSKM